MRDRYQSSEFVRGPALLFLIAVLIAPIAARGTQSTQQTKGGASQNQSQSEGSPLQRMEVMRSRLEAERRSLSGALNGFGDASASKDKDNKSASLDDPRTRLKGLEKEASSLLSDVTNLRGKQERAEKYDLSDLDRLETSVAELNGRVDTALRETASARRNSAGGAVEQTVAKDKKKKKGFFGRIMGRGDDKYEELISTAAPGRDRELFEEAAKFARKSNYETARVLFNVIITTYPESNFLPLAKLAIADTFYREGTTSTLIQSAASYRDWLTFFPTDPLADDVMLKMAEAEMRQMGLADRDVTHARKAETQLKVILQQFPKTTLRGDVQQRLDEVQENLAMHNLQIARFYRDRSDQNKGGLKGAQSRLLEITQKYPNFSYMDEVLFMLGTTYMLEEEPDEAAKYYQQIARDYSNGEYAEKAKEQLGVIGAPVPDPDPIKSKMAAPDRPSFTKSIMQEVLGTTPVTINKDGVLIGSDDNNDLLQAAIERGGILPAEFLNSPERRAPGRPFNGAAPANNVKPATNTAVNPTPANTTAAPATEKNDGLSVQPTRPGAPAGTTPSNATPTASPSSVTPPATVATPPATPIP